jgi:hypothetical protein
MFLWLFYILFSSSYWLIMAINPVITLNPATSKLDSLLRSAAKEPSVRRLFRGVLVQRVRYRLIHSFFNVLSLESICTILDYCNYFFYSSPSCLQWAVAISYRGASKEWTACLGLKISTNSGQLKEVSSMTTILTA